MVLVMVWGSTLQGVTAFQLPVHCGCDLLGMSESCAMGEDELFDPAFLERLRFLTLRLRKRRQLRRKGTVSTPSVGMTREFKDYRPYARGEDYRAIDWALYARLERLFVRLYEETQELNVHVVVDCSGSMEKPFAAKRVLALRFALAVAYLGLSQQQRVSLYGMTDQIRQVLPGRRGVGQVEAVRQALAGLNFGGTTDLAGAFRSFRPGRERYGVIFVLSDFYGADVGASAAALSEMRSWPGEVHLVQIYDPQERSPGLSGELELAEVETGERRRYWFSRADARRYEEAFDGFVQGLQMESARRAMDFLSCSTGDSFEVQLLDLLGRGGRLNG
jgi:uncharacterized protein (DUF58 family)